MKTIVKPGKQCLPIKLCNKNKAKYKHLSGKRDLKYLCGFHHLPFFFLLHQRFCPFR
jgi:hypothetical protein